MVLHFAHSNCCVHARMRACGVCERLCTRACRLCVSACVCRQRLQKILKILTGSLTDLGSSPPDRNQSDLGSNSIFNPDYLCKEYAFEQGGEAFLTHDPKFQFYRRQKFCDSCPSKDTNSKRTVPPQTGVPHQFSDAKVRPL